MTRFEEVVALLPGKGQNIDVTDDQRMKPLKCQGGQPTMVNIDRVDFTVDRQATGSSVYIAQAPEFGPGATPPEQGGKGITFIARGSSLSFGVGGTAQADTMSMGMSGKRAAFDFHQDGQPGSTLKSEIDAFVYAKDFLNILVRGDAGNDRIVGKPDGQSPFDGPLKVPTTVYGEGGRDDLRGGYNMDYLDGGSGGDRLIGYAGADQLFGGPGLDSFDGGGGRDEIDSIDRLPGEDVDCGPGNDLVRMDLKDQDVNCETFRFP